MNHAKQRLLINMDNVDKYTVNVYGIGSIGSHLVKGLAKLGFSNIEVWDFDVIEEENICAQAYWNSHIGLSKAEALFKEVKEETNIEIKYHNEKITEDYKLIPKANTIIFCGFDSIEGRKMMWDKFKKFPVIWMESRIGRFDERYYIVDLRNNSDEIVKWAKEYEDTLNPNGPSVDLKCGEKCCNPVNKHLTGLIEAQFIRMLNGMSINPLFIGNLMSFDHLHRLPDESNLVNITPDYGEQLF